MSKQSDPPVEEWRDIPGHPGYQASSLGRIRSLDRVITEVTGRRLRLKGKVLKWCLDSRGYPRVSTGTRRTCTVHSLVAEAFLGERPKGMEINHIDSNPTNPAAVNLEYCTHRDNMLHSARLGRKHNTRGSANGHCKFTELQIRHAMQLYAGGATADEACQASGVSRTVIYSIANGLSWTHLGLAIRKRPTRLGRGK